ncbi:MAG: TIGR02757 family protein [Candidatus Hydrogenedens sp.]
MITKNKILKIRNIFDRVYTRYHHKQFALNDPVHWIYSYPNNEDKEIIGLISALFAFGNAKSFNSKIKKIISLWHSPSKELLNWSYSDFQLSLAGFQHRFVSGGTVANFLYGLRRIREEYGTIGFCMLQHYKQSSGNLWHTLQSITDELRKLAECPLHFLVPMPNNGGACKRLWLYLRWMVRRDEIDVGCWDFIRPSQLIIPLDTHIYQWAISLRLISPRSLNAKTAMLLTEIFRQICPEDPLRYDFSLCQAGMLGMRDKILYDERKGK